MEVYNYYENVLEDVKQALTEHDLKEYDDKEEAYEALYDDLFIDDSVTGNDSGSYTFNTWQAEENLCHNLGLLEEACEEFGSNIDILKDGAEACDVTIRCYLLSQCLNEALEDYAEIWEN